MNLKHLNTFLVLSKIKNFTKTAEYLHYAQSNVTTQIKQLEEELNVKLFERIGKNVIITAEGERLIPYAGKMLALSSEIKDIYTAPLNQKRIVIGASESLSIYKLPNILKEYRKKYPDVEIFLKLLYTSNIIPLLTDNTIDIAFILEVPINTESTITAFIKDEPICVLAAEEHGITAKEDVAIYDFKDIPMILTNKDCCFCKCFRNSLANASIVPKIILETSSIQVIKENTLSGLGLCLLPEFTVKKELDNNSIKHISYETNYNVSAQLIYHKDKWVSPHLLDFISTVQNCY